MSVRAPLAELLKPRAKDLLRFLTCGSVDDGKSTLIGRLLYDSKLVLDDQIAALETDSRRYGANEGDIDFALLVDGLEVEREQGITIDVAYKFFSTPARSFIVADTPGHEQYTRNMASGASTADLAVLIVDARNGIKPQTRRHAIICSLFGIRHVTLAVNKMDMIAFDRGLFDRIVDDFEKFAIELGFSGVQSIPVSARFGDNVSSRSNRTPWYGGPCLIEHLESVDVESSKAAKPFRFPVQWVNRANADFRGYAGTIATGSIRPGDAILASASSRKSTVQRIVTRDGDRPEAFAGDAVTLTLADDIDIGRGDVLAAPVDRPEVADQFAAHVLWMADEPLFPGRSMLMRIGAKFLPASVTAIKHKLDIETHSKLAAKKLGQNEIGICNVSTSVPIAFDAFRDNRETGAFILIDRATNQTAGAGMIDFALRRASNVHRHSLSTDKAARASIKHQAPCIVWLTGLSGSGKSTIADLVEKRLNADGRHTMLLDGDNIRHGLNSDLGFTDADRVENIRRIGEVAKLFVDAGLIVVCAFISPFEAERRLVRAMVAQDEFLEVFVDTPLETCIARDPKGLYAKALAGQLPNFTGVGSPYERPSAPDMVIETNATSEDSAAQSIIALLQAHGRLA